MDLDKSKGGNMMEQMKAKLNFLRRWKEDVVNGLNQKNEELEKLEVELIEANTKLEVYNEIPAEHHEVVTRLQGDLKVLEEKKELILSQVDEQKDIVKSIDNKIKQVEISYRY